MACAVAYAVALLAWLPALRLAWQVGYFRIVPLHRYDETMERVARVSRMRAAWTIFGGALASCGAIALAVSLDC